jgi:hypothetical protein
MTYDIDLMIMLDPENVKKTVRGVQKMACAEEACLALPR